MSKITASARDQECQIRIPGICNHNPETTVFAHLNGAGMGRKQPPLFGAYACYACHDAVDGRSHPEVDFSQCFLEGFVRTLHILLEKGLVTYK